MFSKLAIGSLATILAFGLAGCTGNSPSHAAKGQGADTDHTRAAPAADDQPDAEIIGERAKLSPEDRALVEAQEWCVVSNDGRLGSMGPPIKLEVDGQPVFICCKGCQKKALADHAKTLAKLEELKARKKEQSPKP